MLYALVPPLENQNSWFRWYRNPAAQRNLENKFGNSYEIHRYHRALKIPRILWNFYSDRKILLSIQLSAWLLNLQLCESWLCTFHLKSCFSDSEEGTPLPSEEGSLIYRAQLFVAWLLFSLRAWDDWHRTEKSLHTQPATLVKRTVFLYTARRKSQKNCSVCGRDPDQQWQFQGHLAFRHGQ